MTTLKARVPVLAIRHREGGEVAAGARSLPFLAPALRPEGPIHGELLSVQSFRSRSVQRYAEKVAHEFRSGERIGIRAGAGNSPAFADDSNTREVIRRIGSEPAWG